MHSNVVSPSGSHSALRSRGGPWLAGNTIGTCERAERVYGRSLKHYLPDDFQAMCDMTELRLWSCNDSEIPHLLWHLERLETLEVCRSQRLESVPASIGRLKRLRNLSFSGCTALLKISDEIGRLDSLQVLDLSHCLRLQSVPYSVRYLHQLRCLDLRGCNSLRFAPESSQLPATCEVRLPRHLLSAIC